jgi:hypothetical protein
MSSAPTVAEIAKDATWLVQAFDQASGNARAVHMTPQAYREASFLDDRIFQRPLDSQILPWTQIASAAPAGAREDARWIFHIGHVGSTLVARLLGELQGVLSIREPRVLRDMVVLDGQQRAAYMPALRKLFSRTFGPDETALIKATSFVSEMAAELVPERGSALFMFATPRTYVQTILAGENSRKELQALADWRAARLSKRVPELDGWRKSDAHLAAASWACEMTSLAAAEKALPKSNVRWADFDRMLADMPAQLLSTARFFGFDASPERSAEIAAGPLMRRYSKALEYEYSPDLRRELLYEADRDHRAAIDDAMLMLKRAAAASPLLARALDLSQFAS